MSKLRQATLREWAPPVLVDLLRTRLGAVRFTGNYPSWDAAMAQCAGYSAQAILESVTTAALAVKEGRAAFERDSVLLDRVEYSWPLLAGLLWVAGQRDGRLHILDFGGSLGTTYRQNRSFLCFLREFSWSVVEQAHFVECGQQLFEDGPLRFFPDLESCLAHQHPDVVLFSGVLQYLRNPYELLDDVMAREVEFIILDRTPFLEGPCDRLCVQHVSPRIYQATYPAWFLSHRRFLSFLRDRYRVVEEFDSFERANVRSRYLGQILERVK